jgi:CxxC motif-containing protein (DUF1111 family)
MRHRGIGALVAAACLLGGCRGPEDVAPGEPLPDLTAEERSQFDQGREVFERIFSVDEGLGPIFNENSCNACHSMPTPGGSGEEPDTHATRFTEPDQCDLLVEQGGVIVHKQVTPLLGASLNIRREEVPANAVRGSFTAPPLYGMGLIEAIPEATILTREDPDDADSDGISGRAGRAADGRLARFRRKADLVTLAEIAEAAVRLELGLTTPLNPTEELHLGQPVPEESDPVPDPELDLQSILRLADFIRLLAPPARFVLADRADRRIVRQGETLFSEIGCAACHVPSMRTGPNTIKALDRVDVGLFSDLLLHDMGPELADVCGPVASPSEIRTEMLMGLRYRHRYMHNGRVRDLRHVIALHSGEGAASRAAFDRLRPFEQEVLVRFLTTL